MKMNRVKLTIIMLTALALTLMLCAYLFGNGKKPSKELEELLHGGQDVKICKIRFDKGYTPGEQVFYITNQAHLDYLSAAFRKAVKNEDQLARDVEATIYFDSHNHIRTMIMIPDDAKSLIVCVPTFLNIDDPAMYRVRLSPPMPEGLSNFLHAMTIYTNTSVDSNSK